MIANLNAISKLTVGDSAEYGVTMAKVMSRKVTPDGQTREAYEEITWDIEALETITDETDIVTLKNLLASKLARVGQTVTLHEWDKNRTLDAAGVNGTLPGYPIVEIVDIPQRSYGAKQAFTLKATTRVGIADENDIVEHTTSTETITNNDGTTQTSVRGSVRLDTGINAPAWIETNVLAAVRTQAALDGNTVVTRVTNDDDSAAADYTYTVAPQGNNGPGTSGVTEGRVEDRINKDISGKRSRVISGYAIGPNAATFAAAQRVPPSSTLILIREDEPSTPSVPDGRVSFRYEYVFGYTSVAFPSITILRLNESVDDLGGGRPVLPGEYLDGDPVLRLGISRAYRYRQSIEIEFIGTFANAIASMTPLFAADNISGTPTVSKRARGNIKTVRISWEFVYSTPVVSLPDPRTVDGVSA